MIVSFRHAGLEQFFRTGSKAGIIPSHSERLQMQLAALNAATAAADLNAPSWKLHALKGDRAGYWAITVKANWRLTFKFTSKGVEVLDYLDYH
ncbi:MAG: Killer protein [Burkholderiales bacterium]|nr:MAG: Killer protein [Burkholderiales bacterium]